MKDRFGREYLSSFIALRGRHRKAKKPKAKRRKPSPASKREYDLACATHARLNRQLDAILKREN